MIPRVKHPALIVFLSVAVLFLTVPAGVNAQNTGMQELLNRVDRLQRELTTLQRQVYQGERPPLPSGPSASGSTVSPRTAARQTVRISQLENEISRLTGTLEEINFGMRQIKGRLDKLVIDLDQRLTSLEARDSETEGGNPQQTNVTALDTELDIHQGKHIGKPEETLLLPPEFAASKSGVLGTIPKSMAVTSPRGPERFSTGRPPAAPKPISPLPPGTPKSQYDYALSLLLKHQDFSRAEEALKAFVKQYPRKSLTGNAQYWLGETYYVRKRYQDAAFAFAEGYQKYSDGRKAPDSLLKLGMSLSRMKKRAEACTAFTRFLSNYPTASARLKARINRERIEAKCR